MVSNSRRHKWHTVSCKRRCNTSCLGAAEPEREESKANGNSLGKETLSMTCTSQTCEQWEAWRIWRAAF
eukprot:3411941-Amphidinium_carterae.1